LRKAIAQLSPCISEAVRQLLGGASDAPQVLALNYCLVLDGTVESKAGQIPLSQKNRPGTTTKPPMSAMRSINFCQNGVKRKTLNVVDLFVPCLFVVVMFLVTARAAATFCASIQRCTLKHPSNGEQSTFPQLVQNLFGRDIYCGPPFLPRVRKSSRTARRNPLSLAQRSARPRKN